MTAVTVEGIPATQRADGEEPHWDSVDCGLFFGGKSLETAERVEFAQLKYSGDPNTAWSLARLTASSAKTGNNSVLRKLADDFKAARTRMSSTADLRLRFVSNQPVDKRVIDLLQAIAAGSVRKWHADQQEDVDTIAKATGLGDDNLAVFVASLDFSECGSASRFSHREKVILAVADLVEDAVSLDVPHLRQKVRELMLPERRREYATRKTILAWFNIADEGGLFPSPPKIAAVERPVPRDAAKQVADALIRGERVVCLHGPGGCGKTTSLQQLPSFLPSGSCFILFDCYGGGSYLFADDRRHRPENAFLQIANDLARELGTPFFLLRDRLRPIELPGFLRRVAVAADVVASARSGALLVITIDAADSAVTAATRASRDESCFVHELNAANLGALPPNVRVVVSARTARVDSLRLPRNAALVECPPFSLAETAGYVGRSWPVAPDAWIAQFHYLSDGVPRVQHYAIESAGDNPVDALDALRPRGKKLDDILRKQFEVAVVKLGDESAFERLVASLAVLPPPIPREHLAAVSRTTPALVDDLVRDLSPGLRLDREGISIADEDVEDFIERQAQAALESTRRVVAEHFHRRCLDDAYAATHIGDALIEAGRGHELLRLIEEEATLSAIADPIVRREVQVRRLRLALRVCRGTGSSVETLKVILLSAEANSEESALREVLEREVDLAVHFAWPTLRRLVLADRSGAEKQGSVLAQDAARAAHASDPLTARERLASHNAWLKRRNDVPEEERGEWTVSVADLVARAEAVLEFAGADAMLDEIKGWKPPTARLAVGLELVPALIAAGKEDVLSDVLNRGLVRDPWNLLISVALAVAGRTVDPVSIARSLGKINRRHIPSGRDLMSWWESNQWQRQWFELLLMACELAASLGVESNVVLRVVRMLRAQLGREVTSSQSVAIDGLVRTWLLEQHLTASATSLDTLLALLHHENEGDDGGPKSPSRPRSAARDDRNEELTRALRVVFPAYLSRLALVTAGDNAATSDEVVQQRLPTLSPDQYPFDYSHWSAELRSRLARSVVQLMFLPGGPPGTLFERATAMLKGRSTSHFGTRLIPLLEYLLLRPASHRLVIDSAAQETREIRDVRSAASEKVDGLLQYSRLLLRVSPGDAEALFASAVELTKEMDQEAFAKRQLELPATKIRIAGWVGSGGTGKAVEAEGEPRRGLAARRG
ncbi:MAG: hypothetical protein HY323_12305 [Betaproteobacteria bacterium]|nr:hypothetical protein [Betaproteobacteria bacterium]